MNLLAPELVDLARRVVDENRRHGRTFALAESCTGGLVSAAITEVPGCSDVFEASFVTYSSELKTEVLKVSQDLLETFGSVSIATAWAMAQATMPASARARGANAADEEPFEPSRALIIYSPWTARCQPSDGLGTGALVSPAASRAMAEFNLKVESGRT